MPAAPVSFVISVEGWNLIIHWSEIGLKPCGAVGKAVLLEILYYFSYIFEDSIKVSETKYVKYKRQKNIHSHPNPGPRPCREVI